MWTIILTMSLAPLLVGPFLKSLASRYEDNLTPPGARPEPLPRGTNRGLVSCTRFDEGDRTPRIDELSAPPPAPAAPFG